MQTLGQHKEWWSKEWENWGGAAICGMASLRDISRWQDGILGEI